MGDIKITEHNIKLTLMEKASDSRWFAYALLPFAFLIVMAIVVAIPFGLLFEHFEEHFDRLRGTKPKEHRKPPENPFDNLSFKVEFAHIFLLDNSSELLKTKYHIPENHKEIADIDFGQIKTELNITNLPDALFDQNCFAFRNKLFLQELQTPAFKGTLSYIDGDTLTYHVVRKFEDYAALSFEEKNNTLEITARETGRKTLFVIE